MSFILSVTDVKSGIRESFSALLAEESLDDAPVRLATEISVANDFRTELGFGIFLRAIRTIVSHAWGDEQDSGQRVALHLGESALSSPRR